jgi:hypothetical protein
MSISVTKHNQKSLVSTPPSKSVTSPALRSQELLEHISQRLDRIEARMAQLDPIIEQLPGLFAMGVDTFDDFAAMSAKRGYELDYFLKTAFELVPRIQDVLSSPEFISLMDSGMLSPNTLSVLSRAADAINSAKNVSGEAGLFNVMRSTRDKGVRRALHFAMQVLREFGARLDAPPELSEPEAPKSLPSSISRS